MSTTMRANFAQKQSSVAGARVRGKNVKSVRAARSATRVSAGLNVDLTGKKAFVAGVADDNGFGWAISKALSEAGAEVILGTWVPALNIFETSYKRGKFDESRKLSDGSMMTFSKIYPMDAVFDDMDDVP